MNGGGEARRAGATGLGRFRRRGRFVRAGAPGRPAPPRPSLLGAAAPAIAGEAPDGAPAAAEWAADRPTVVVFATSSCTTCAPFWEALAGATPFAPGGGRTAAAVVVTPSPSTESRRAVARLAAGVPHQVVMSSEAWIAYGVVGSPWFAMVDGGAVRAEGTAGSPEELDRLFPPVPY